MVTKASSYINAGYKSRRKGLTISEEVGSAITNRALLPADSAPPIGHSLCFGLFLAADTLKVLNVDLFGETSSDSGGAISFSDEMRASIHDLLPPAKYWVLPTVEVSRNK